MKPHNYLHEICSTIYADSTGADSSGADNTVSIALFTHSFPRSGPKNQHHFYPNIHAKHFGGGNIFMGCV